jgi:hypothetical protein
VRCYCQGILQDAGFETRHRRFEYSTFPGRWGTPLGGACLALLFLGTGALGANERPLDALALLLGGGAVIAGCARWLARYGVLDLPFGRLPGNNLASTRGTPKLWLVAHLDSKSQPIPIGVRAAAIIASILLLIAAGASLLAQLLLRTSPAPLLAITVLGMIAALPVASSFVGDRSNGVLDNASGLATVLRVVELLPRTIAVCVMLTTAEELGLAGARAWARESAPANAINIDSIDDTGALRLVCSGRKPRTLLDYLGEGWPAASQLPPGLLMDGIALADAGWEVVNVSKGSWRTVSRIHTSRDDLAHLDGSGVEEVAALLATSIIARTSAERRSQ